jgi:hypothetical protein
MGDFVIFLFDSAICVETVVNGSDFFRVKKKHTHTPNIRRRKPKFGGSARQAFVNSGLGLWACQKWRKP